MVDPRQEHRTHQGPKHDYRGIPWIYLIERKRQGRSTWCGEQTRVVLFCPHGWFTLSFSFCFRVASVSSELDVGSHFKSITRSGPNRSSTFGSSFNNRRYPIEFQAFACLTLLDGLLLRHGSLVEYRLMVYQSAWVWSSSRDLETCKILQGFFTKFWVGGLLLGTESDGGDLHRGQSQMSEGGTGKIFAAWGTPQENTMFCVCHVHFKNSKLILLWYCK